MHQPLAKNSHLIANLLLPPLESAAGDKLLCLVLRTSNLERLDSIKLGLLKIYGKEFPVRDVQKQRKTSNYNRKEQGISSITKTFVMFALNHSQLLDHLLQ